MTLRTRRRSARRSERGTAFVETALVVPFLITVMLASFELGMAWRAQMTVSNAARAGARVASNVSINPMADHSTLASVSAGLNSLDNATVNWVTIYKVTGTDITPPAACISAAGISNHGNAASSCNTVSGAELAAIAGGSTAYFGNCADINDFDRNWCPTTRSIDQNVPTGPEVIGVAMSITYPSSTKLFGSSRTIVDQFAMKLEPTGLVGVATP